MSTPVPTRTPSEQRNTEKPWSVVVHDDPVNLMSYVTWVFQSLFGFPRPKAQTLMLRVHNAGRATVSSGPRERCEADCQRLHAAGLWATVERP